MQYSEPFLLYLLVSTAQRTTFRIFDGIHVGIFDTVDANLCGGVIFPVLLMFTTSPSPHLS